MDIILEMAKDMGEAIQQDPRYVALQMAQAKADEDQELQNLIGEFNLKLDIDDATEICDKINALGYKASWSMN